MAYTKASEGFLVLNSSARILLNSEYFMVATGNRKL